MSGQLGLCGVPVLLGVVSSFRPRQGSVQGVPAVETALKSETVKKLAVVCANSMSLISKISFEIMVSKVVCLLWSGFFIFKVIFSLNVNSLKCDPAQRIPKWPHILTHSWANNKRFNLLKVMQW